MNNYLKIDTINYKQTNIAFGNYGLFRILSFTIFTLFSVVSLGYKLSPCFAPYFLYDYLYHDDSLFSCENLFICEFYVLHYF